MNKAFYISHNEQELIVPLKGFQSIMLSSRFDRRMDLLVFGESYHSDFWYFKEVKPGDLIKIKLIEGEFETPSPMPNGHQQSELFYYCCQKNAYEGQFSYSDRKDLGFCMNTGNGVFKGKIGERYLGITVTYIGTREEVTLQFSAMDKVMSFMTTWYYQNLHINDTIEIRITDIDEDSPILEEYSSKVRELTDVEIKRSVHC